MLAFQDEDAVSYSREYSQHPKGDVLVYPIVVFNVFHSTFRHLPYFKFNTGYIYIKHN